MKFIFKFYEVPNPYGRPPQLRRTLYAEGAGDDRYNQYFDAISSQLPDLAHANPICTQLSEIDAGLIDEVVFGGNGWNVYVRASEVRFESEDFEEWNQGPENIFSYDEFKAVLFAWREFLSKPDAPSGTFYEFETEGK